MSSALQWNPFSNLYDSSTSDFGSPFYPAPSPTSPEHILQQLPFSSPLPLPPPSPLSDHYPTKARPHTPSAADISHGTCGDTAPAGSATSTASATVSPISHSVLDVRVGEPGEPSDSLITDTSLRQQEDTQSTVWVQYERPPHPHPQRLYTIIPAATPGELVIGCNGTGWMNETQPFLYAGPPPSSSSAGAAPHSFPSAAMATARVIAPAPCGVARGMVSPGSTFTTTTLPHHQHIQQPQQPQEWRQGDVQPRVMHIMNASLSNPELPSSQQPSGGVVFEASPTFASTPTHFIPAGAQMVTGFPSSIAGATTPSGHTFTRVMAPTNVAAGAAAPMEATAFTPVFLHSQPVSGSTPGPYPTYVMAPTEAQQPVVFLRSLSSTPPVAAMRATPVSATPTSTTMTTTTAVPRESRGEEAGKSSRLWVKADGHTAMVTGRDEQQQQQQISSAAQGIPTSQPQQQPLFIVNDAGGVATATATPLRVQTPSMEYLRPTDVLVQQQQKQQQRSLVLTPSSTSAVAAYYGGSLTTRDMDAEARELAALQLLQQRHPQNFTLSVGGKTGAKPENEGRAVLFVGQLNYEATDSDVRDIFGCYGTVLKVVVLKDRGDVAKSQRPVKPVGGSAFVTYGTTQEADAAITALHGRFSAKAVRDDPDRCLQVSYANRTGIISPSGYMHALRLHRMNPNNPLPQINPWEPKAPLSSFKAPSPPPPPPSSSV